MSESVRDYVTTYSFNKLEETAKMRQSSRQRTQEYQDSSFLLLMCWMNV